MDVKAVNDVPSGADILHIPIRPITSLGLILTYRYRRQGQNQRQASSAHVRAAVNFAWNYCAATQR